MKKLLIIPYLGVLNESALHSLHSLLESDGLFVLFITDNKPCINNTRLKKKLLTKSQIESIIFNKLKIKPDLSLPYKLCDFKPFYWKIFEDYFDKEDYDYIGYCDIDVIYGDINSFIDERTFKVKPNIIGSLGHFCIFDETVQGLLLNELNNTERSTLIKFILEESKCYAFDEFKFLHVIFSAFESGNNIIWNKRVSECALDLSYFRPEHYCNNRKKRVIDYLIKGNSIFAKFDLSAEFHEVPYVHFQKRPLPSKVFSTGKIELPVPFSTINKLKYRFSVIINRFKSKFFVESFFRKNLLSRFFK